MAQNLFLLVSMAIVCLPSSVHGFPLTFDTDTTTLSITTDGCGTTKLCLLAPADCNISSADCLFASITASEPVDADGRDLNITMSIQFTDNELRYMALGLTANTSVGTSLFFLCTTANDSTGNVTKEERFLTIELNNTDPAVTFTPIDREVIDIVRDINISTNELKCRFTVPNITGRSLNLTQDEPIFFVILAFGKTNDAFTGTFDSLVVTTRLNLADPNGLIPTPSPAPSPTPSPAPSPTPSPAPATTIAAVTNAAAFTSPASLLLWITLAWSAVLRL